MAVLWPLLTIITMCNIWITLPDTISTIEQNVKFQVGISRGHLEVPDQMQNGRPVTTFDLNCILEGLCSL